MKMPASGLRAVSARRILSIIVLAVAVLLASWSLIRFWFMTAYSVGAQLLGFIDVALTLITGLVIVMALSGLVARYVGAYGGPTRGNVVRLLFQVAGFSIVLVIAFSMLGVNLVSALVGIGFFGIVVGLAAQATLGNLFSGLMLLASRPFNIGDRIALITWQYGKFPPSLSHGWLEPAYTGSVKEITLMYTKIVTDSKALVTIPNGIVTQSLILNLSHDEHGHVGTQFEVPIHVDPQELHRSLNSELSRMPDFRGEEESFELLELSPSAYLVAISYRVEKQHESQMKPLLLNALRVALANTGERKTKPRHSGS